MSDLINYIAEKAAEWGVSKIPVAGPAMIATYEGIKLIDVAFNEKQKNDIAKGRERNGGCPHVLLAFCAPLATVPDASGPDKCGDRSTVMKKGKRFKYSDIDALFWHPSMEFRPGGNPSGIYSGEDEKLPEEPKGPSIGPSNQSWGKSSCLLCSKCAAHRMSIRAEYAKLAG